MAEIATLGIEIQNGDVIKATRSLEGMTVASAKTEAATQRLTRRMALLEIEARQMDAEMDKASRSTFKLTGGLGGLTGAFQAVAASMVLRQLVAYSNEYTNLHNRLALVTTDAENLAAVEGRLFQVSQDTRTGLEGNVVLYSSLARSTKALGLSQQQLIDITGTVSGALVTGGASASEADSAIRQLSQAFASGVLRGDEFNSMAENAPRLQELLAKSLGVSIGQLRAMAEQGLLTTDKLATAFLKGGAEIRRDVDSTALSISQAMTKIRNAVLEYAGTADQANGVSRSIAEGLSWWADTVPTVLGWLGKLVQGWGLYATTLATVYELTKNIVTFKPAGLNAQLLANLKEEAKAFFTMPGAEAGGALNGGTGGGGGGGGLTPAQIAAAKKAREEQAKQLKAVVDAGVISRITAQREFDAVGLTTQAREHYNLATERMLALKKAEQQYSGEALKRARLEINNTYDIRDATLSANDALEERRRLQAEAGETAAHEMEQQIALAQREADAMAQPFQNLAENIQREFGNTFAQVFRDGTRAFRNLFDVVRDLMARLAGEMVSLFASKKLIPLLLGTTAFGGAGGVGNTNLVSGLGAGIARDAALGGLAGGFLGYGIGSMTTSRTLGALGGAASGALAGFAVAGPIGAATGALTGFIGGIVGAGHAAREAAKQQELLRQAYKNTQAQIAAQLSGDTLKQKEAQIHADFDLYREQAKKAAGSFAEYMSRQGMDPELTSKFGNNLNDNLALLNQQEAQFVELARQADELLKKQAREDLDVRTLRNQGLTKEADLQAKINADRREMDEAIKNGMSEAYRRVLAWNQSIEENAIATGKAGDAMDKLNQGLNQVAGYKDTLQRTIFGLMPEGGTIGGGYGTRAPAGSPPFTSGDFYVPAPSPTPTPVNGPQLSVSDAAPSVPAGGSGDLHITLTVDGRKMAATVLREFKKVANAQYGESMRWGEITSMPET